MSYTALTAYLPPESFNYVDSLLKVYPVRIIITNPRQTRLGTYCPSRNSDRDIIRISGTLNQYQFAIVLIHEIAHLYIHNQHKRRLKPHGKEWKDIFRYLLFPLIELNIFPPDLTIQLTRHLKNPKASGSTDSGLIKCLKKYDLKQEIIPTVEEIPQNGLFLWRNERIFRKENKLRTRYKCVEIKTRKVYLFSPLAEVTPIRS